MDSSMDPATRHSKKGLIGCCNRQMSIPNLEGMLVMLMNADMVRIGNARKLKQVH